MLPWDPDYDAYVTLLDDTPASFMLDLAAASGPIEGYDRRIQVRVPLDHPRPDGLRAADEEVPLGTLEDRICAHLDERCAAVFVGHVISEGILHIVCYAPGARIGDEATLLEGVDPGGYEVGWMVEEEPDWDMYFEFMYPGPAEHQIIQNRRLLQIFDQNGDDRSVARIIDHTAMFETGEAGRGAAEVLTAQGFDVDEITQNEAGLWVLQFHREDHLAEGRADEFCLEILELLEDFEGMYDGWGAPLTGQTDRPA